MASHQMYVSTSIWLRHAEVNGQISGVKFLTRFLRILQFAENLLMSQNIQNY